MRLAGVIQTEHDYKISTVCFWSDKGAVIGQIRGPSKRHPAFIANRLSEILDTSEPNQWRHCPGKLYPTDDDSRGLRADAVMYDSRWLNGPAFLLLQEDQRAEDIPKTNPTPDLVADTPVEVVQLAEVTSRLSPQLVDLSRYSSFSKVCRITAYVRRFIQNCRSKPKGQARTGPLEVQEVKEAKLMWIKSAQREAFSHEISNIEAGRNALRRFVARRGPSSDIYSDNGTNFVGANRELKQSLEEWNHSQIADFLSQKEIQWHFNPPSSPHFGGIWERLVQSCKKALKGCTPWSSSDG